MNHPGKNTGDSSSSSGQGAHEKQYQNRGKHNLQKRGSSLHYLDDSGYAFGVVHNLSDAEMINVEIGGVCVDVMIDSGASFNVMNRETWEFMKKNKIQCVSENKSKQLFAYGSNKLLPVAGVFRATVKCCDKSVPDVEFVVIEGQGHALLGKRTAVELGILHIGPLSVNVVQEQHTMFEKYPECFRGIGKLNNYQLEIPIDSEVKPVVQKTRRIPFSLRDKLSQKLDEREADDIIEKVSGPSSWVSPVVLIPKRNDIRLCVDMRQANTAVRRKIHPIPTIEEMLCNMNQSKVISKLDIRAAYHQIKLTPESRDITTFTTHKGLYRYKRLMFGVSCAPEMYQSIIPQVFQGCDGVTNMMDDILIHGRSECEHDERLEKAMQVVKERGLTLNPDKCCFKMSKVTFMGHVLSEHGISQSDVKVKAVVDAREPKTSAEVCSFLGLVNYSARFISDLATISAPLRVLTRKNEPFHWGREQEDAFVKLKNCIANAQTLSYFEQNARTILITDASPVGLGAVLVQEEQGEFHVISYASRSLSDTEKRYLQTEKEALGRVWGCERFHLYLYGIDFELWTDHKPLECIFVSKSKPCACIEQWVLRLQPYRYKVRYIVGNKNIADALSRLVKSNPSDKQNETDADHYVRFVTEQAIPTAMRLSEIEKASEDDPELVSVRKHLIDRQWHHIEYKEYLSVKQELCAVGNVVLRGTRILILKVLRERVLEIAHEGHPGIVGMKQRLRTKVWWPGIDRQAEKFCRSCHGCQLVSSGNRPEPMTRTELPSSPWQHLAADLSGPLPSEGMIPVLHQKGPILNCKRYQLVSNPNGEEVGDDKSTIHAIWSSALLGLAITIMIMYSIVRWRRGKKCPFDSRCCPFSSSQTSEEEIKNGENIPLQDSPTGGRENHTAGSVTENGENHSLHNSPNGGLEDTRDSRSPEMTTLEYKPKEEHSFVLDYIGTKASADIITKAVRHLGTPNERIENTQHNCRNDQTECNIQLLFMWYRNVGDVEHPFVVLSEALKDNVVGGRYLTELCFSKNQFDYKMGELKNEDLEDRDVVRAASHIKNFSSLVRFWGLAETDLDKIKADNVGDYEAQARKAVEKCWQRRLIKKRKDICDGLVYVEEKTAIVELKKFWLDT